MNLPVLVIVNGPPCAGKTHITKALIGSSSLLCLTKDKIKETVYDTVGWSDREWSRQLGSAACDFLWAFARNSLTQEKHCLIEANFRADLAASSLSGLTGELKFCSAQIFVSAKPSILAARFRERACTAMRHPGHLDAELQHEYSESTIPVDQLTPIPGSDRTLWIDTSNIAPDIHASNLQQVQCFLAGAGLTMELLP